MFDGRGGKKVLWGGLRDRWACLLAGEVSGVGSVGLGG